MILNALINIFVQGKMRNLRLEITPIYCNFSEGVAENAEIFLINRGRFSRTKFPYLYTIIACFLYSLEGISAGQKVSIQSRCSIAPPTSHIIDHQLKTIIGTCKCI